MNAVSFSWIQLQLLVKPIHIDLLSYELLGCGSNEILIRYTIASNIIISWQPSKSGRYSVNWWNTKQMWLAIEKIRDVEEDKRNSSLEWREKEKKNRNGTQLMMEQEKSARNEGSCFQPNKERKYCFVFSE